MHEEMRTRGPNPKCRLFLQIDQQTYLAAGDYLSEAPIPSSHPRYTLYKYVPLYLFTQGRE